MADRSFSDPITYDAVIVSDLGFDLDFDPRGRWPSEVAFLRAQFARGTLVCSVCTGALMLAEAGLLTGTEATSHWGAAPILTVHYPDIRLRPERVLVAAGPEGRVVTSGGYASWAQLALWLVARFAAAEEAMRTARPFLLDDLSAGQAPFMVMPTTRHHGDGAIAAAQAWAAEHYAHPDAIDRMQAAAGLAKRTFGRRFRTATGMTPIAYLQALRIEEAKELLERSDLAVEVIAAEVGYADPPTFRRLFRRLVGLQPSEYRRRFKTLRQRVMAT